MLSERGIQIIEKLIENNRTPITSKTLAFYMGRIREKCKNIHERSLRFLQRARDDTGKKAGNRICGRFYGRTD